MSLDQNQTVFHERLWIFLSPQEAMLTVVGFLQIQSRRYNGKVSNTPNLTVTGIVLGCWICTAITGLCLVFRYAAKCWISLHRSNVKSTDRIWGFEDVLFAGGWVRLPHLVVMWLLKKQYRLSILHTWHAYRNLITPASEDIFIFSLCRNFRRLLSGKSLPSCSVGPLSEIIISL